MDCWAGLEWILGWIGGRVLDTSGLDPGMGGVDSGLNSGVDGSEEESGVDSWVGSG